jgi:hypothetical protein
MLSLRSLAFILYSAIRRACALSCAALHCFPDRTKANIIGKNTHTSMLASMVVGADLYIDAVLKDGVRVRRIADIALSGSGYAPKRCEVARYEDIVKLVKPVWPTALEYYRNPYKLRVVFRHGVRTDDTQEPMICSKLVSEIIVDLEIKTGLKGLPLLQPFPKDISKVCSRNKWRRFALLEYDLFSASKGLSFRRAKYTEDTLEQLETLHSLNLGWRALKRISSARGSNSPKRRR